MKVGVRQRVLLRGMAVTAGILLAAACAGDSGSPASTAAPYDATAPIDPANLAYVTGTLTYLQRIALPKDAVVAVELLELPHGAARPGVVAERRFEAGGQVPIRFELPYDRTRIIASHNYGVRGRIYVDGALWFTNEPPIPVLTHGNPASVQILLRPASPKD